MVDVLSIISFCFDLIRPEKFRLKCFDLMQHIYAVVVSIVLNLKVSIIDYKLSIMVYRNKSTKSFSFGNYCARSMMHEFVAVIDTFNYVILLPTQGHCLLDETLLGSYSKQNLRVLLIDPSPAKFLCLLNAGRPVGRPVGRSVGPSVS